MNPQITTQATRKAAKNTPDMGLCGWLGFMAGVIVQEPAEVQDYNEQADDERRSIFCSHNSTYSSAFLPASFLVRRFLEENGEVEIYLPRERGGCLLRVASLALQFQPAAIEAII